MRIWIGVEKEGKDASATLFAECQYIDAQAVRQVQQTALKHGIRRIYFGAGKKDVLEVQDGCLDCLLESFKIVVETSYLNIAVAAKFPVEAEIVLRHDTESDLSCLQNRNVVLKSDDGRVVGCASGIVWNSIESVKDGMYETDKEIEL